MKISSVMKSPVVTVKPRESIRRARELMERRRINQLPVVVDATLVGIVTDRDLRDAFPSALDVRRPGRRHAADPTTTPVEEVMTANVVTLSPDASLEDCARVMRDERFGAVPIVADGRLVGIVTRSDVLEAFLKGASPRSAVA
jgi:acetoin utilization protein AcuB